MGFKIEQPIRLLPENSQNENAAVLSEYRTKWMNTRSAWLTLLEYRFKPDHFSWLAEEKQNLLKEQIVLTANRIGNSWMSTDEWANGIAYYFVTENSIEDGYTTFLTDSDGWFTMTDIVDLYFI